MKPSAATVAALHMVFAADHDQSLREFVLLTLNAAGDSDSTTYAIALRDTSALVRRLAVIGRKQWVDDRSPLVRYEALRVARSCERAVQSLRDPSVMVQLSAIDMLGDKKCDSSPLRTLVRAGKDWRARAHALVALAKAAPDSARPFVRIFSADTGWHTRVYAATAARIIADSATLATLARDAQPNVATEAMTTTSDAIRALGSNHAGLLLAAANRLKGTPELRGAMPQIVATLQRLGAARKSSTTDARVALMERIDEAGTKEDARILPEAMSDLQPSVFFRISDIQIRKHYGFGDIYQGKPLRTAPADTLLRHLAGASAQIVMKGLGPITLELYSDEAPLTVAKFVELAENGSYNGLTFHRIVPNFVIQGGSPGANEYDGLTQEFLLDEVGLRSHLRGTLGISTRGHDTGDGQIFINLVDNFRLDHQYTVFARVTSGMDIVDKVQEGDVMESVKIIRRK